MDLADRSEDESIRRYQRMITLRNTIDEAVRRAEARLRLENALRHATDSQQR